jgi:adenine-specific DNA methylase
MTPERKRLIEVSLPLAEISKHSAREKSIRSQNQIRSIPNSL